ncbi:F-box protein [Phanerochaete sordida]|uniref:F-box protein n=1 Tax=Phanerochaete sordida TaxID=48140 RepID=A0A9P3G3U9_9APHY|nr:F-box protein [Phanerochaete sordida]
METGVRHGVDATPRATSEVTATAIEVFTTRNNDDLVPLSLPDELILEIFSHHVTSFHYANSSWKAHRAWSWNAYGWLAIAHVCRRWRDIVLSAPALWTTIKATSPACVGAFFDRSGQMPMSVVGALNFELGTAHPLPHSWIVIFENAHRIGELHLEYDAMTADQFRSAWIPTFPQLKFLALTVTTGRGLSHDNFPPVLLHVHKSSHLETLETSFLTFSVASQLFAPNLRDLTLSNFGWPTDIDASARWVMLLDALKGLPKLEKLSLLDGPPDVPWDLVAPNASEPPKVTSAPAPLLNLQQLVVRSCSRFGGAIVGTLLENIEVRASPALRQLYMIGPPDRAQGAGVAASSLALFGAALGRKFAAAAAAKPPVLIRSLSLEAKDARRHGAPRVSIGARSAAGVADALSVLSPPRSISTPSPAPESNILEVSLSDASAESIFQHVFTQLPLDAVHSVTIDELSHGAYGSEPYVPTDTVWRETFAHAKDVQHLTISGRSADHLPTALHPQTGHDGQSLFPKLQGLKLRSVAFLTVSLADGMEADEDGEEFWVRGRWYEQFVVALKARSQMGMKLQTLSITGTEAITEAEVLELRAYAEEVNWEAR